MSSELHICDCDYCLFVLSFGWSVGCALYRFGSANSLVSNNDPNTSLALYCLKSLHIISKERSLHHRNLFPTNSTESLKVGLPRQALKGPPEMWIFIPLLSLIDIVGEVAGKEEWSPQREEWGEEGGKGGGGRISYQNAQLVAKKLISMLAGPGCLKTSQSITKYCPTENIRDARRQPKASQWLSNTRRKFNRDVRQNSFVEVVYAIFVFIFERNITSSIPKVFPE